jgi:anhydro-N-acetylmuramic acid kinase
MAMNRNVQALADISNRDRRHIIGLMSGTSLDGLDIAYCAVEGHGLGTQVRVAAFETIPYDADFKAEIRSVFSRREVDLEKLCLLNAWVALRQAGMVNDFLFRHGIRQEEVDLIASHGQTVYHAPKALHGSEKFGNATLQIGDGDHIAHATGIITVSDFRQKHVAAGGEGAPLAVYGDHLIFSRQGEDRIMLNMGGVANFTFLPGSLDAQKIFSTDTGPGNTMMDAWMQRHFPGRHFDEDAAVARTGTVIEPLLLALKDHPFFLQSFPRTTGPELFNLAYLEAAADRSGITALPVGDTMATLNRFSADTIAEAIRRMTEGADGFVLYASGGGMHNPLLMERIGELLPGISVRPSSDLGIHPDAKEAVLFAILANECIAGGHVRFGNASEGIPSVTMGKVSFPG